MLSSVLTFSSLTGAGRFELLKAIDSHIGKKIFQQKTFGSSLNKLKIF